MTWEEVRQLHPHQWLLLEAFDAYTEGENRITPHLEVLGHFADPLVAWDEYARLHRLDRAREMYVFHTDRVELDIRVMYQFPRVWK